MSRNNNNKTPYRGLPPEDPNERDLHVGNSPSHPSANINDADDSNNQNIATPDDITAYIGHEPQQHDNNQNAQPMMPPNNVHEHPVSTIPSQPTLIRQEEMESLVHICVYCYNSIDRMYIYCVVHVYRQIKTHKLLFML